MNRSRLLFFWTSFVVVLLIVGGSVLGAVDRKSDDGGDSLYRYLSVFTEVFGLVRQAYVEPVDASTLMAGALDGTTDALDPFSLYLPADQVTSFVEARKVGDRLSGLVLLKDRGIAYVAAVEPGSPAAEAGVEVSDVVSKLQGRSTRLEPPWEIQEVLGGAEGAPVSLELIRRGETKTAKFRLGAFESPPAGVEEVEGVSMIRVGGLRPGVADAVRQALSGLDQSGVDKALLDLRGVAAGDPDVAYRVAGLFVQGPLGELQGREGARRSYTGEKAPVWQGRLVVLVDRGTLGAAEILATVLEQKAGAELLGEPTFGYCGHQELAPLGSGARLLYTDAFYTGPDGKPIRESLEPDVPVTERSRTFEEKDLPRRDLILRRGVRHLTKEAPKEPVQKAA